MTWWRAHDTAVDNAKLQRLPGEQFKAWFNLCCLASANRGVLPSFADIAFKLRVSETKARNVVETLQEAKLIDTTDTGLRMHDWNEYQYSSDVSTTRVKRFRKRFMERQRNGDETFHETPEAVPRNGGETFHETAEDGSVKRFGSVSVSALSSSLEVSLESKEPPKEQACGRKRKSKTQLPDDFAPNRDFPRSLGWPEERIDKQIQAFFDSARAHSRVYADWQAAWRNWCTSPFQQPEKPHGTDRDVVKSNYREAVRELGEYIEKSREDGDFCQEAVRLLPGARRG